MKENKSNLKDSWKVLAQVLLSPDVLFLLIVPISLIVVIYFSLSELNAIVLLVVILVIALLAGVLGSLITHKTIQVQKENQLRDRGFATIRNMNLLLSHIYSLKKRVNTYSQRLGREEFNYDLLKANFEEIIENCNNLFEDIVNTIENWQDIIPEANLKGQVGAVSHLKQEIFNRMKDLKDLKMLSGKIDQDINPEDRGKLKVTIDQLENTLNKLETELQSQESKVLIDKQFYDYEDGKLVFSEVNQAEKSEIDLKSFNQQKSLMMGDEDDDA